MNIELVQLQESRSQSSPASSSAAAKRHSRASKKSSLPCTSCSLFLIAVSSVLGGLFMIERYRREELEVDYVHLDQAYKNMSARIAKMHDLAKTYAEVTNHQLESLQREQEEKEKTIVEKETKVHELEETSHHEAHKLKLFDPGALGIISVAMLVGFLVKAYRQDQRDKEDARESMDIGLTRSEESDRWDQNDTEAPVTQPKMSCAKFGEEFLPGDAQAFMENVGAGFVVGAKYATSMVAYAALLYQAPQVQPTMSLGIKSHLWGCVVAQTLYTFLGGFPSGMAFPQDIPCLLLGQLSVKLPAMVSADKLGPTWMLVVSCQSLICGVVFYIIYLTGMAKLVLQLPASLLYGFVFANGLGLLKSAGSTLTRVEWRLLCPSDEAIGIGGCKGWMCLLDTWTACLVVVGIVNFIIIIKVAPELKACMMKGTPGFGRKLTASFIAPFAMISCIPPFFLAMYLGFFSMDTAIFHEWLPEAEKNSVGMEFWQFWLVFYDYEKWDVRAVLELVPEMFSIAVICLLEVAMGSCSVESSCPRDEPLDLNNEFRTHAIANLIGGCTGGSTTFLGMGMTINAAKSDGASHRMAGLIAAFVCVIVFCLGLPLATYTPRFMSGSVFLVVGYVMIEESALENLGAMPMQEYLGIIVCGIIFVVRDMEAAMVWGFLYAMFVFLGQSVESKAIRHIEYSVDPGTKIRSDDEELILKRLRRKMRRVDFDGMVFWGSSRDIFDSIFPVLRDPKTKYIIFNMTSVIKMDGSACKVIGRIVQLGGFQGIRFVFVLGSNHKVLNILKRFHMLLRSTSDTWDPAEWPEEHGHGASACPYFSSLDSAVCFLENASLAEKQIKSRQQMGEADSAPVSTSSNQDVVVSMS